MDDFRGVNYHDAFQYLQHEGLDVESRQWLRRPNDLMQVHVHVLEYEVSVMMLIYINEVDDALVLEMLQYEDLSQH